MKGNLLLPILAICVMLGGCNFYYADQAAKRGIEAHNAGQQAEDVADHQTANDQYKRAKMEFTAAATLDPKGWSRHYNLAAASQKLQQYAQAIREYDLAIQYGPGQVRAHKGKVDCLVEMHAAQSDIDQAVQMAVSTVKEPSQIYIAQANAYHRMNRLVEMPPVLENAVRAAPRDSHVRAVVGRFYLSIGDTAAAIKHLEIAYQLDPKEPRVAYDLGTLGQRLPPMPRN